jgi:hypothetical protein
MSTGATAHGGHRLDLYGTVGQRVADERDQALAELRHTPLPVASGLWASGRDTECPAYWSRVSRTAYLNAYWAALGLVAGGFFRIQIRGCGPRADCKPVLFSPVQIGYIEYRTTSNDTPRHDAAGYWMGTGTQHL